MELSWIGIPVTMIVFAFILIGSRWLLPERMPAICRFDDAREYTVEMMVEEGSALSGKTIEQPGSVFQTPLTAGVG
ncbi:MAG: hypothetical protein HKP12_05645 [Gammaproteobacteria bacterium]|nr:hypothetical protein [Gammaproteobacteria bacterium]